MAHISVSYFQCLPGQPAGQISTKNIAWHLNKQKSLGWHRRRIHDLTHSFSRAVVKLAVNPKMGKEMEHGWSIWKHSSDRWRNCSFWHFISRLRRSLFGQDRFSSCSWWSFLWRLTAELSLTDPKESPLYYVEQLSSSVRIHLYWPLCHLKVLICEFASQ